LGWKPLVSFEEGIRLTVEWYQARREWWKKIKTGEYLDYYNRMYKDRWDGKSRIPNLEYQKSSNNQVTNCLKIGKLKFI